jgi:hypothetical protein
LASRGGGSLSAVTRRSAVRASDVDRELVAGRLRDAATEGRLTTGELEDRLGLALSARTYGQLNSALSDLPASREDRLDVPVWARASLAVAGAVGVLAAAATAALLFTAIACLSAAWMVVTRAVSSRGRRDRRGGYSPDQAIALRPAGQRTGVPGGERASLN